MSSGEDIEAGRITTCESTTVLLGAIPSEQNVNFNGTVILEVGPQPGALHPTGTLNGIFGIGSNPTSPPGIPGGVGVIGNGGSNGGIGVQGDGGNGGTGVVANGGNSVRNNGSAPSAGVGVMAHGGMVDNSLAVTSNRALNGPGIVAAAGGAIFPTFAESGNTGIFGQGGNQVDQTKTFDSTQPPILVGPDVPGPGVIGRGGIALSNQEVADAPVRPTGAKSAGVVGVAGGMPIPPPGAYSAVGVFGISDTGSGVVGLSTSNAGVSGVNLSSDARDSGPGVVGFSSVNNGGVFSSDFRAQLHLSPVLSEGTPTKKGEAGDILATIDGEQIAHLWFCRRSGDAGAASWVQLD